MPVLVLARAVQGFGMGLAIVSVYVVIGRAFPDHLRPRAFAILSAAWVLPAIIGPLVAGFLTDHFSWRWVFWAVVPFVVPPLLLLVPRVAEFGGSTGDGPPRRGRIRVAIVAATGLAMLQQAGTIRGVAGAGLAVVGLVLLLPSLRHLLPAGALRFARGLPTVVVMRGILAGAFFAGEAFVPLALQTERGRVDRAGRRRAHGRRGRLGARLAGAGPALRPDATPPARADRRRPGLDLPGHRDVLARAVGALLGGRGLVDRWARRAWASRFGAIGTLTLDLSEPEDQGANVAALQVCDSVGSVVFVGIAGAIYGRALDAGRRVRGHLHDDLARDGRRGGRRESWWRRGSPGRRRRPEGSA